MVKNIFVNATSATVGGSLTILNQFVEAVNKSSDSEKKYYIFCPIDCKIASSKFIQAVNIDAKKYKDRQGDGVTLYRHSSKKQLTLITCSRPDYQTYYLVLVFELTDEKKI